MTPFHLSALRHIAYHLAALAGVALLVRLGYGDRAHATLAAACATGLAGSLLLGITFVRGALRWRITRRLWSPNDWVASATMTLGLSSFAALCTVGLLASSLWNERWPVWAPVVVRAAFAGLILSIVALVILVRRSWHSSETTGTPNRAGA